VNEPQNRSKLKFTDMPDGWTPTKAERDRAHDAGVFYPDEMEKVLKRLVLALELSEYGAL
jgi:hypothetical protein